MSKYIFNNDTDILEFLEQLRENGIQIWGEGEKIRYRSKNRQLAPETLRILKMAKGQILDFFRMIEKNVIPLTSIQTAYVVGQTAGCELGNINAHYYIEYTIESLDVERLEQMINLVISKNDALRLIVTHEGKASFLDNVPYYSVPVYSLYDGNDREQKRLERSHHRYNYYKWPMFHFCVGKTSGKTSVLHVDFDCIILDAWSAKLLLNEIFSLYYGKDVKFPRISFMNYMRLKTDKGDIIGMVPVTFIVNTNVDRNDIDHPLHLYHRIELTFSTGRLCLVNTHGPVIWLPFLHMPRDEYGTLSINVEEEVNIPSGVTIGNVMLPSVKETFEQIWPDAVKKALEILFKQNRTEKMSMAQYQIYVSKLWSEICQKVGYMNIVDYDNFGDIKNIFYDLEKRHLIKKENDGIE